MRATISAYRLTGTLEVAFHVPDGTSHQHIVVSGVHLWINFKQEIQQALLVFDDEDYESNGSLVLGTRFTEVNKKAQLSLLDAEVRKKSSQKLTNTYVGDRNVRPPTYQVSNSQPARPIAPRLYQPNGIHWYAPRTLEPTRFWLFVADPGIDHA